MSQLISSFVYVVLLVIDNAGETLQEIIRTYENLTQVPLSAKI